MVSALLEEELKQVVYRASSFRLSRLMRELPSAPWSELVDSFRDVEIRKHMDAGNEIRRRTERNDAVAMLGVGAIRESRVEQAGVANRSLQSRAYILNSLKRREEIETLRRIYGSTFYVLAAYAPRDRRVQDLSRKISESRHANQSSEFRATAEELLARDEDENDNPFGQDVRHAFPLADVIVNSSDQRSTKASIRRFVELLFGNTFHTPTRDEEGIFAAYLAACRSASLARQVGATICREDGSFVATGTNEVARANGGQYWCDDEHDGRDFQFGLDRSDQMRENILRDILNRLQKAGWLNDDRRGVSVQELTEQALYKRTGNAPPVMKGALFTSTIDFVRAVHAEMAAITTAARHGVSVEDCTLYTTTFPCHDCAKHIIASGIRRVVYVEPYPKSLVHDLYQDSAAVDAPSECGGRVRFDPFVGIAPRRYWELFALSERRRKERGGAVVKWRPAESSPRLPDHAPPGLARLITEQQEVEGFTITLRKAGIMKGEEQ